MGLDMYANERIFDENFEDGFSDVEIAYWRKHNRLHGWMEALWRKKTATPAPENPNVPSFAISKEEREKVFNCEEVEITLEDLDELEIAINDRTLPETAGFFFGGDSYDDYEKYRKEADEKFIADARKSIANGNKIFYNSWW